MTLSLKAWDFYVVPLFHYGLCIVIIQSPSTINDHLSDLLELKSSHEIMFDDVCLLRDFDAVGEEYLDLKTLKWMYDTVVPFKINKHELDYVLRNKMPLILSRDTSLDIIQGVIRGGDYLGYHRVTKELFQLFNGRACSAPQLINGIVKYYEIEWKGVLRIR